MNDTSPSTRLRHVRQEIDNAASLSRRRPDEIALIAVSKTHPSASILPLLDAGHCDFGENRVQEAQEKWPALKSQYPEVRLHLVGQLQSNKAEEAVELFDVIHSVDRASLIAALGKAMAKVGRNPACFLQVNVGEEEQKGGCSIPELPSLLDQASEARLSVIGLMCIPPAHVEPAPYFALLAKLARRHGLLALSMGMSSDFETAVTLGATHLRVGTALFGSRA